MLLLHSKPRDTSHSTVVLDNPQDIPPSLLPSLCLSCNPAHFKRQPLHLSKTIDGGITSSAYKTSFFGFVVCTLSVIWGEKPAGN